MKSRGWRPHNNCFLTHLHLSLSLMWLFICTSLSSVKRKQDILRHVTVLLCYQHSSQYHLLCSAEEGQSCRFEMTGVFHLVLWIHTLTHTWPDNDALVFWQIHYCETQPAAFFFRKTLHRDYWVKYSWVKNTASLLKNYDHIDQVLSSFVLLLLSCWFMWGMCGFLWFTTASFGNLQL